MRDHHNGVAGLMPKRVTSPTSEPFEEAPGGTPNVQNPKRADALPQLLNNDFIHKRGGLHPDARIIAPRHLEVVIAIAACLVPIGLSKRRQFDHGCSLSLALPNTEITCEGRAAARSGLSVKGFDALEVLPHEPLC